MSEVLQKTLGSIPLGEKSPYPTRYNPNLLCGVSRKAQRQAMGFGNQPFYGVDIWNAYEVSFFNEQGKPLRHTLSLRIPAHSDKLIESKSLKLYFNSLNEERFVNKEAVLAMITSDLSKVCQAELSAVFDEPALSLIKDKNLGYTSLDEQKLTIDQYERSPQLLKILSANVISEKLCTHLFKSHCLVTGQPDWGSIFIEYSGPSICHESLLKYLISFYRHQGFSENCVEQIFIDILEHCKPEKLNVIGRFTRRGGIDINPVRSTDKAYVQENWRLIFQ